MKKIYRKHIFCPIGLTTKDGCIDDNKGIYDLEKCEHCIIEKINDLIGFYEELKK